MFNVDEKDIKNESNSNTKYDELVKVGEFIDKFENGVIINSLKKWNKDFCETIENYENKKEEFNKVNTKLCFIPKSYEAKKQFQKQEKENIDDKLNNISERHEKLNNIYSKAPMNKNFFSVSFIF